MAVIMTQDQCLNMAEKWEQGIATYDEGTEGWLDCTYMAALWMERALSGGVFW